MLQAYCLGVLLLVTGSLALYDSSSNVVNLDPSNFDSLVTSKNDIWLVEFYAPWCGHCQNLVPEYKKVASALKGVIKVGAVDADQHKSLGQKYGVTGFPTILIFTGSKHTTYQGQRTAEALVNGAMKALNDAVYLRLGVKNDQLSGGYKNNAIWRQTEQTKNPDIKIKLVRATSKPKKNASQLKTEMARSEQILQPLQKTKTTLSKKLQSLLQANLFRGSISDTDPPNGVIKMPSRTNLNEKKWKKYLPNMFLN